MSLGSGAAQGTINAQPENTNLFAQLLFLSDSQLATAAPA